MLVIYKNFTMNLTMNRVLNLFITLLSCAVLTAQTHYKFRHYSVRDGLSQNTVTSIIQDKQGFMWFGTWDGLNKFDGQQFTTYKSHPGDASQMSTNRIDYIYQDRLDYIWFQTYDGRLHRFDPRSEKFESLSENIEAPRINGTEHNMVETKAGELWLISLKGVIRVGNGEESLQMTEYNLGEELEGEIVNFVDGDSADGVWIGTDKCIHHINAEYALETFKPDPDIDENDFTTIFVADDAVWFGTALGQVWRLTTSTAAFDFISLPSNGPLTDLVVAESKTLLAVSLTDGFFVHNLKTHKTERYYSGNNPEIKSDEFVCILLDSHGMAWLENTQSGIFRYNVKTEDLKHLSLDVDAVHRYSVQRNHILYEDVNGRLWLNLIGGGFCWYDRKADALNYFFNNPADPSKRFTNVVHTAFSDHDGNLWLSTYEKGLDLVSSIETPFEHYTVSDKTSLTANEVRAACQTSDGHLIIGTKDGLLRLYDKHFRFIGYITKSGEVSASADNSIPDLIYCIMEDESKRLWLGSKGGGVILLIPNYAASQKPKYKIQRFNTQNGLSSNDIYSIISDHKGNVYIGTYGGGLNILKIKNGTYSIDNAKKGLQSYPLTQCSKIRTLLYDTDGTLWVGTTNGLLQMDKNESGDYRYYYYRREPGDSTSLSNNDVHCLIQDHTGNIYLGTFGGGLCRVMRKSTEKQKGTFRAFTTEQGLANDIVLAIVEDRFGNIWLSSEKSVSRFDVEHSSFQNFQPQDDNRTTFSESTGIVTHLGFDQSGNFEERAILFGCNTGYYIFRPNKLAKPQDVPSIVFTQLFVNNQLVTTDTEETPLQHSISYTESLDLNYHQRNISLRWIGLDYEAPENILYAYYLEGFDKHWNYCQTNNLASYTNLLPGDYVLHVKSTNNDGIWCENEKTIQIHAHAAPWATGWAYIFYIMLIIGVLYLMYYLFSRFNHLRNEVEVEQKVMDIKLRFFTNISHELRTPLSLIKGPVDNILSNERITPNVREQLEVVESNTNRMLRMINQILDFRKIQAQKMRLKVQKTNVAEMVEKTVANFRKEISERGMQFDFQDRSEGAMTWLDRDKMDIVVFNLLSNAFKFTPDGKKIHVLVEKKNNFIYIRVKDEGMGIKPALVEKIFDRYSTSDNESLNNVRGTGIGLNLVKELVDMHKGYIEVESREGHGSQFSVLLRIGRDHFSKDEVDFVIDDPSVQETNDEGEQGTRHITDMPTGKELPKMVVVEDNVDMCKFIRQSFSQQFEVFLSYDGAAGERLINEVMPDIVITDIMMPSEDGITMLTNIKKSPDTCHIPVIVLTAREYDESRLEALRAGADDYITKPFSPAILEARITNIMAQRERLQEKFRRNLLSLTPEQKKDISPDEAFLAKLMNVMEKNMDNNALTVDELVSEMALGRTVFFNKIKSLTGLSPVEFIREIRIKRAAQLLDDGKYNITEITYMVGMNDSRYFSKCFKAVYGMTPSEYKKHQQEARNDLKN